VLDRYKRTRGRRRQCIYNSGDEPTTTTTTSAPKTCYQSVESYRMPWIPSTLVVDDPLASYLPPEQECHLCYEKTKSTPGFAADPNTCQRFVMCEPDGQGGWNTFNMTCPVCTFWDQELLTCVQVYDGPISPSSSSSSSSSSIIVIIIIKSISSSINSVTTINIIITINVIIVIITIVIINIVITSTNRE
ncbi:hypothetical protein LSAT2_016285, partial [Lamellibrachia satsuma]